MKHSSPNITVWELDIYQAIDKVSIQTDGKNVFLLLLFSIKVCTTHSL